MNPNWCSRFVISIVETVSNLLCPSRLRYRRFKRSPQLSFRIAYFGVLVYSYSHYCSCCFVYQDRRNAIETLSAHFQWRPQGIFVFRQGSINSEGVVYAACPHFRPQIRGTTIIGPPSLNHESTLQGKGENSLMAQHIRPIN